MQKSYSEKPFVNKLMRVEHGLVVVFNWVCAIVLFAMVGAMFLQVAVRFVFKDMNVPWTDELSRYLWVSITYIGMGIAISENAHVEISLVTAIIAGCKTDERRRMWARIIDIIRFAIMFGIACFLVKYSWTYMLQVKKINMVSAAMQIPTWWLDAVLVVGVISMAIHSFIRFVISIVDDGAIVDPMCLGKEDEE